MLQTHVPMSDAIATKKSPINGTGVFSKAALPADVLIGQFEGRTVEKPSRHSVNLGGRHIEPTANFILKFLNHSCSPNTAFKEDLLFTTAAIGAGEELTIDYRATEKDLAEPFACNCPKCLASGSPHPLR